MQEGTNSPISTHSSPVHNHRKYLLTIIILILLAVASAYAIYAWQHSEVESLNKTASSNSSQLTSLQEELANQKAAQAASVAASVPAPETDQAHVQRVATAYIHRFKAVSQTDKPSFTANEKTVVNGNFAIQYFCGPGECSQTWLKKVGNTWTPLGNGLGLDVDTLKLHVNDYGWPPNFTQ